MKVVAKRLQPRATNVAMASTATSRRNSSVEGKKLCGGSIKGLSEELEEEEEVGLALGFRRFFGVEDISYVSCGSRVAEKMERKDANV
jgi:hypothetical protein